MDAKTRLILIVVQLCFGVFPILGKLAMAGFAPRAVLAWRLLGGAGVLMAIAIRQHGRAALPGGADLLRLAGLSVLGIIVNQLLFLEGLHRSTAVNAGLLMTVIPVATLAIAVVLRQERLTGRRLAGILLSVAGVASLFAARGAQIGVDTTTGDLLMTLNAISYSTFLVLAKPVLVRLPQLVVVAWIFTFGALAVPWFVADVPWAPELATETQWWALIGIVAFPTILGYLLNTIALARTLASTNAAFTMLQPIVATALGVLVLGERPEIGIAFTAAGVLSGLWLVSTPGRRRALAAES